MTLANRCTVDPPTDRFSLRTGGHKLLRAAGTPHMGDKSPRKQNKGKKLSPKEKKAKKKAKEKGTDASSI